MAIELISKIKPKNGGNFPMVDAEDVLMPNGKRLSDLLIEVVTQIEYDALVDADTVDDSVLYLIREG